MFTLQILHASDLEGGVDAIANAPNFAAVVDALEADAETNGFGSVLLSAGDNYIPGPFFNASQFIGDQVFTDTYNALFADELGDEQLSRVGDGRGYADIAIMNIIGFDASAVGNHEFDSGPDTFESIIEEALDDNTVDGSFGESLADIEHFGAQFPYLSANLDFSESSDLGNLFTDEILPSTDYQTPPDSLLSGGGANPFKLAASTIVETDGEQIGVIGATTQRVESISSTGAVTDVTGGEDDMEALAAVLQPEVDRLIAEGLNKVILVSHLQDINLETELAGLLSGVDVIIAGGSDTRLADDDDRLREGDEADDTYPVLSTDADGNPIAIVSTDGEYSYVGRLVIDFDENGNIVPDSIDSTQSGAFATDDQGVVDVTGAATAEDAIAASESASLVQTLTDAVATEVNESDGTVFGESEVFLDGRRESVRTQETNFGNLTADANLAAAQSVDPDVVVSLKNGGGIRAQIGEIDGETGELLPPQANPASGKLEGQVSELDIQNALRFDNGLVVVDLSAADLKIILEHAVASSGPGSTPGQFPQVGGVLFSFDPEGTAQELDDDGNVTTPGTRIQSIALIDGDGNPTEVIVEDGAVVDGAPESIKVVTLDFLAGDEGDLTGGDGYPYRALSPTVVDLGMGEQAALQDFLSENHPIDGGTPFTTAEVDAALDSRIQDLSVRSDSVDAPAARDELTATINTVFQGDSDPEDEDSPEGASEVVDADGGFLYVTNGNLDRIDIFALDGTEALRFIDLTTLPGYDGVQSVAAGGGLIVAVVDVEPTDGVPNNGIAALYDAETLELITTVETGNLPDSVSISPDGTIIAIANEGEFNSESDLTTDAAGTVTLIDVEDLDNIDSVEIGFDGVDTSALRTLPGVDAALDIEPEFTTITADNSTLFVSLQENNGIAQFDLTPDTGPVLVGVIDAGTVDHSVEGFGIDSTDDEVIDIETRDVLGLRMPDAITTAEIGGSLYILGANEGDGRGDGFDDDGNVVPNGDEARVGDLVELGLLDPDAYAQNLSGSDLPIEEAQEVTDGDPVADTAAAGTFSASLDAETNTLTVDGTFADLSGALSPVGGEDAFGNAESAVHVHLGDAGSNGGIVFNLTVTDNGDGSGSFTGSQALSDEQAAAAAAEGLYVNLHTETNPAGELRGQIILDEAELADPGLERLIVSTIDGDTDGDGDIDQLHSFGSRSFTIWDASGNVVFDSGDEMESIIANIAPERFNDDDGELGQNRSDAKGPEPEAIAVGEIGAQTYAFIGAERDSGVFIYNITDPADARFVSYLDGFETSNIGPETIAFIGEDESETGNAQIAVAYEISGTTVVYDLDRLASDETTEDFYTVALGRSVDIDGYDFWSDVLDISSDALLAEAFEVSNEFQSSIDGLSDEDAINLVTNNALGRDATEAEQTAAADLIAQDGFSALFLELLDGSFDTIA